MPESRQGKKPLLKKVRVPARTLYRVDWPRRNIENFYAEVWDSTEDAQKHIDDRNPKYKSELVITEFVQPEHDAWEGRVRL